MTIDVIDLRNFYSQRLGAVARRLINRGIKQHWPHADGLRVAGLGYPTPYLGLFREDSERCIAFSFFKLASSRLALASKSPNPTMIFIFSFCRFNRRVICYRC